MGVRGGGWEKVANLGGRPKGRDTANNMPDI